MASKRKFHGIENMVLSGHMRKRRMAQRSSSLDTFLNGFHGQIYCVSKTELKRQSRKCGQGGVYSSQLP